MCRPYKVITNHKVPETGGKEEEEGGSTYNYFYNEILIKLFILKPTRCTNFTNLFWHETLHVLESPYVHHHEFIHCMLSNGICHTGL